MIGAPPTKAIASVPDLAPFHGLRYTRGPDLSLVTAPPYDVIDPDDHAALEAHDPHNSVRLILPRAEGGDDAYVTAARTLAAWRGDGVLDTDTTAALYPYRMVAARADGGTHTTIGVIGSLALPDVANGEAPATAGVLPHERTLPKARSDRLSLLRATRANLDPIWVLTLAVGVTELLEPFDVVEWAVDAQGVRHELGVIDDPERIAAIRALLAGEDAVLADGHHRFETACNYRREGETPGGDGIMCLVVELDDAQLDVRPFHRIIEHPPDDLRERLAGAFAVRDAGPVTPETIAAVLEEMDATGTMGLVDASRRRGPRPEAGRARGRARRHPRVPAPGRRGALRRRGPPAPRRSGAALQERRQGGREHRGRRGGDPPAGRRGQSDPRRRRRARADAGEDDLLRAQAADGHGHPHTRRP